MHFLITSTEVTQCEPAISDLFPVKVERGTLYIHMMDWKEGKPYNPLATHLARLLYIAGDVILESSEWSLEELRALQQTCE